jgi:hypothetical protein
MHGLMVVVALLAVLLDTRVAAQAPDRARTMPRGAMGQPLPDGELPPGVLIVRVVEGEFVRNVVGQEVEVRSLSGGVDRARTGADGRALFDRLPPGARVQVVATVAGETLKSEEFAVPVNSGARLLLTASAGAAAAGDTRQDRTVWFIARILGTLTILAFAAIIWRTRRPRFITRSGQLPPTSTKRADRG